MQELIAPTDMDFYDGNWARIGTKHSLIQQLAGVTGIGVSVLWHEVDLALLPVAKRMSWAANRVTTRIEDIAYCLLGIFRVNMPMLYGEGAEAFIRLQEFIMKDVNDLTLFAWTADPKASTRGRGIFAQHPSEFADGGSIYFNNQVSYNSEFTLTNKGVRLEAGLAGDYDIISLDCHQVIDEEGWLKRYLGIYVRQHGANTYTRIRASELAFSETAWRASAPRSIYVSKNTSLALMGLPFVNPDLQSIGIHFRMGFDNPCFKRTWLEPQALWDAKYERFLTSGAVAFTGAAFFQVVAGPGNIGVGDSFLVVCGIEPTSRRAWVVIGTPRSHPDMFEAMRDLTRLSELAREMPERQIVLSNIAVEGAGRVSLAVSLSETVTPFRERLHVVDIEYKTEEEPMLGFLT